MPRLMSTIGVDPGLTGAVAVLDCDGGIALLADIPVVAAGKGGAKVRNRVDAAALARLLHPFRGRAWAAVERVAAMPGQGVASTFSLGHTAGTVYGVLAALGMSLEFVAPATWKKHYRLAADKEQARACAVELFPAAPLGRKRDHGRAEALLIARWLADRGAA